MIFGVDVGYRRLAVVEPSARLTYEIRLPTSTPFHHQVLGDWIRETIPAGHQLWVESPIQGASGDVQTCIKIAEIVGTVLANYRGETDKVAVSQWKKAVIGHGHADKDAVTDWLLEHHPALAEACQGSQDLRDAACVGIYGELRARGEVEAPSKLPRRRRPRTVLRPGGQQSADEQTPGRRSA